MTNVVEGTYACIEILLTVMKQMTVFHSSSAQFAGTGFVFNVVFFVRSKLLPNKYGRSSFGSYSSLS